MEGKNSLWYDGRIVQCWTTAVDGPSVPEALNLKNHRGKVVEVSGHLCTDLWDAEFVKIFDKDREAKSLNELLRIRAANREAIEKVNGNLGTALGYKQARKENTKHPCIIIFVPEKKSPEEVSAEEKVPTIMEHNGKWCFTDVVTGGKAPPGEFDQLPELSMENKEVVDALSSKNIPKKDVELIGGIKLMRYLGDNSEGECIGGGTAAIAVQDQFERIGFLTNQHVAGEPGRPIYHPNCNTSKTSKIGTTEASSPTEGCDFEEWYGGIFDESNAKVDCDYAFIKIEDKEIKVSPGLYGIGDVGPLMKVDPDKMNIIGQKVTSVGSTRGIQKGTIEAYSYEYLDENDINYYADFLIRGEGNAFSLYGDSGKLIVTDDEEHRPIALHWGGGQERLRHNKGQEVWGYATDLGKILEHLKKHSENKIDLKVL